tara:strand:+ start:896 stop:1018 length:123 start_codon:yes stop_codon:yes gene_type:complete
MRFTSAKFLEILLKKKICTNHTLEIRETFKSLSTKKIFAF